MESSLLTGQLVRLAALDAEAYSKSLARWSQDSEFWRLMDYGPSLRFSQKAIQKWFEEGQEKDYKDDAPPRNMLFMIRTLQDDQIIGDVGLDGIDFIHGRSFVGIAIGDRANWSKGYGSDAMRVILRYAFQELDLHRVSLSVFEYNPRAIRSYEKVGFKVEGRVRKALLRDGQRYDVIYMGILHSEWKDL
jgi:RimJ/RimL family protein N-acetyltransferase